MPQWRQDRATYFVTFRLADSLPHDIVHRWDQQRRQWLMESLPSEIRNALAPNLLDPFSLDLKAAMKALTSAQQDDFHHRFTSAWHDFLDQGYGSCLLQDPEIRGIVDDALVYFHGERFHLFTSVTMPNHVHAIIQPVSQSLSQIVHSWKSYSAHRINEKLGRHGALWMRESFNRIIRSENSFDGYIRYVIRNPEKARLAKSAYTIIDPR